MALLIPLAVFGGVLAFVWGALLLLRHFGAQAGERYRAGVEETADAAWLRIAPQQLLGLSLLLAFSLGLGAALLTSSWILSAAVSLAGLGLPVLLLRLAKRARDRRFSLQLVDALGNLSNSLKAGFSLPQSFEMIAREMAAPIKQEFGLLTQEMRLGVPMDKALANLLARMPGQDLELVVTAIDVSREVGGNLTEVFENIAGTIRERQRVEGKIRMLSAQGRLQGVIMTLLPVVVAVAISFVSPGYVDPLFTEKLGWFLMALAGTMLVIGGFVIFKILAIDV